MAATRLIALHINKGKSLAATLADRTDYAKNPEKTKKGELVTAYGCDPQTVDEEFLLSKRQYSHMTGRRQENDVIAYQIRQSFKPGEVSAEEANRIGHELAQRFTKGDYAYIVATHTDRAHIHNHIIFNSTSIDGTKKFRNFYRSGLALQKVSDLVCLENGLSVIEPSSSGARSYQTDYPKKTTNREILCADIEAVLASRPNNMAQFLQMMSAAGYDYKEGKYLSFRKKDWERYIRLKSLKEGYREEDLLEAFAGKKIRRETKRAKTPTRKISLALDIQEKLNTKGPGYERWAKTYNLKQMARSLLFLEEHGIDSMEQLNQITAEKVERKDTLLASIQSAEQRLTEISTLKTHIFRYVQTKGTYEDYRKSGYSRKFLEEHREEIMLHKAAKEAFNRLDGKKLPKAKELSEEYAQVLSEKKQAYAEFRNIRSEVKEYLIVQKNIQSLYEAESQEKIESLNLQQQSR